LVWPSPKTPEFNLTRDEADALVANEEPPLDERSEAWLSGLGWKQAMTYVLQAAQDTTFAYDESLLKGLHFMMLSHEIDKRPGRWRDRGIFVYSEADDRVVYEGPDVALVPDLIQALIASLQEADSSVNPIVAAAMAHLNLVMIHPFKDGNGRMSRCLQSLVLARSGTHSPVFLSIEEYLGRYTPEYYEVLASTGQGQWNPQRDAKDWVRFCFAAHFFQGSKVTKRIKIAEAAWRAIESIVIRHGLPDRSITPLIDSFLGRRLRNPYYREQADVSEQVATNDLVKLVKAGLLVANGEKRGRYYTRGKIIEDLYAELRPQPGIPHPYETPDEAEEFSLQGLQRGPQAEEQPSGEQLPLL
jgi:Fic family protein